MGEGMKRAFAAAKATRDPAVFVFQSEGLWLVTVRNRGGGPAKFKTKPEAEAWAERKAHLHGLDGYTVLK